MSDNLIIGGGLAGLYCAWQLHQKNKNFRLLEAAPLAGGRILSISDNHPIDAGPTWFWPHQPLMLNLVQKLNLPIVEQYTQGDTLFQPAGTAENVQKMHYQQAKSYRLQGGMTTLVNALLQQLPREFLTFDSAVKTVQKSQQGWHVTTRDGTEFGARNLFLAVPPRMIIKHLTPQLWLTQDAIDYLSKQQTWMSAQAKYVAIFKQAFWRSEGLSGFAISHKGPLVEIHDATDSGKLSALFGFVGVPAVQRKNINAKQLQQACRAQLIDIYGKHAIPEKDFVMDWANNPFVSTELDLSESPRHTQIDLSRLKRPNNQTQAYFIAAEFGQSEPGYMEGALDAVNRALSANRND